MKQKILSGTKGDFWIFWLQQTVQGPEEGGVDPMTEFYVMGFLASMFFLSGCRLKNIC
jgi:hypothetical protein